MEITPQPFCLVENNEYVLNRIFSFLGPKDLCQSEQVNKLWKKYLVSDDSLWNCLYRKAFDTANLATPYSKEDYKKHVMGHLAVKELLGEGSFASVHKGE